MTPLLWHKSEWQAEAHAWIRAETVRQSIQITGDIEQPHAYPWSTVMRVPTDQGLVFFKATASETVYEIALTKLLSGLRPDCLPELVSADTQRGWMLMRDGGVQLRESIRPNQTIKPWEPVIEKYSQLQIDLADHVEKILATGIPDFRLEKLPALYEDMLLDQKSLMMGEDRGITPEEFQKLKKLQPRFEALCHELALYNLPASLNHGDFHDGNVLVKDGKTTFFDWGDANITHPFVVLRTFFVSVEIALKLDDYSFTPDMASLLEIYLRPWEKIASLDLLRKAYPLSKPAASIVKALSWRQTISRLEGELRKEYEWIVPEVLREFIVYTEML